MQYSDFNKTFDRALPIFGIQHIANVLIVWYNQICILKNKEMSAEMKKGGYYFRLVSGIFGFTVLFLLIFLYIFTALALFTAGLIIFPSALFGIAGAVDIITDIGLPAMGMLGLGMILLGGGMCLGSVFVCTAPVKRLQSFIKGMVWRKRRLYDEEA